MFAISTLVLLLCGYATEGYKILIFFPTPSFSHQQPAMVLTEALIKRGHDLFVVSPNVVPGLENNYTFVNLSDSYWLLQREEGKNEGGINLQKQWDKWEFWKEAQSFAYIPVHQFKMKEFLDFQRRVKDENIKFDVIITEAFFMPFTCAMSRYLNGESGKPIITMSTLSIDYLNENFLGSKVHLSYVPSIMDPYTDRMTLWQKIDNWYSIYVMLSTFKTNAEQRAREFFSENYGPAATALIDGCWSNASLAMLSTNMLYFYPRQLAPNVIELGPMHIRNPEKLPQNLQEWLDGAADGVIYFSLGSNMKSKSLPLDVRSNLLRVFKDLPSGYRVLWKWELDGKIPGQSDNILAQKWLPQQSVLAHPKVKVFVTQGGLQSFQEAVHYGVPSVGVPYFADQESIVAKMVDAGIGARLRPQELGSYEKVKSVFEEVLFTKSYAANMARHSLISRDFTPHSVERGVFWVEHVARHGGAAHLRPSTADATVFEYFCLDILSVILAVGLVLAVVGISVLRRLVSAVAQPSSTKIKKS
nr:PREDICTED: UDP-glucuronosyltransferase 2B18-like [Bemisia tabaci]XP_018895879.1 PREDICTED: UDP-glucuronosyltransferase 2B18-like [Bemisia tabaci]